MGTSQPKGWGGLHLPTTNTKVQPSKNCLQNDGKPDNWLGVRVGTWNVGSMRGRGTEVCKELRKRRMDVCYLQGVRWKGQVSLRLESKDHTVPTASTIPTQ